VKVGVERAEAGSRDGDVSGVSGKSERGVSGLSGRST
jgi:hypothetical protein